MPANITVRWPAKEEAEPTIWKIVLPYKTLVVTGWYYPFHDDHSWPESSTAKRFREHLKSIRTI